MIPSNEVLIALLSNWCGDNIIRTDSRVANNGEVFTPTELVCEMLGQIPAQLFADETKTFCDPSCGNGQFLSQVLIRKLENGIDLKAALSCIYGVEIMLDNVLICRERLLCGVEELRYIVEKNIVCADALTYNYEFN